MNCISLKTFALLALAVIINIKADKSSLLSLELLPIKLKQVKAGDSVTLPCQTAFARVSDHILLILIYKDVSKYPIISFDRRSIDPSRYKLWSEKPYDNRVSVHENKKRVNVILSDVRTSDQSVYRCSVVYKSLPTKITKFQLKVIEPVESVFITAAVGDEADEFDAKEEVGPLELGVNLTLSCHVTGGNPLPNAIWWNEWHLIDNMTEGQFNNSIVNILKLPPLAKEDNFKRFTCQAVNSNMVQPLSASIVLELKLPPSCVKITMDVPFAQPSRGPKIASIPEKQSIQLYCQVLETNLAVDIVWKKNSEVLENELQKYSNSEKGANVQSSSIVLTPGYLDNGSVVRCVAFNAKYPEKDTEDSLILNVLFAPKVRIQLRGTTTSDVEPGEDLYLECQVASNPPVSTFNWRFNGNLIVPNKSAGVLLTASGDSMIIHDVTESWSGQYSCSAENQEGVGQSNQLDIKVITARVPKCSNQNQIVTAAMNTSIDLHCDVEAHPPATSFKWSFLDSAAEHVQSSLALKRTSKAKLKYDIRSPSDFQTLFCRAENLIGEMRDPCIFTVTPKDRKTAISGGCSVTYNVSSEVLRIKCEELDVTENWAKKIFFLSVSQMNDDERLFSVLKMEAKRPLFFIHKVLLSDHQYIFKITSGNAKDVTDTPVYITFRIPGNQLAIGRDFPNIEINSSPTQLLAIILGILFTLLASLIFVCCIKRKKCTKNQQGDIHEGREESYIEHIQEHNPLMREGKVKNQDLNNFQGFMSSGRLIIGVRSDTKYQISNLDNLMDLASTCEQQSLMTIPNKSHSAQNEAFQNASMLHEGGNFFENSVNNQIPSFGFQRNSNSLNSLFTDNSFASDANVSPALGDSALTVVLNPLYEP